MKKYKLTDESIKIGHRTLYRIVALKDFGKIKMGDIGGYVESEDNLSHEGNCWIYHHAMVFKNAKIYDSASVFGDARIYGSAEIYGFAKVSDKAEIYGKARVFENAEVRNEAKIYGEAQVSGCSEICHEAKVYGGAMVYGNAHVRGEAQVYDCAMVYDDADVCGEAKIWGRAEISHEARVFGNARVGEETLIYGAVEVSKTPINLSGYDYKVTITDKHIQIGCKLHTKKEWSEFERVEILAMDGLQAVRFWKKVKPILIAMGEVEELKEYYESLVIKYEY